MEVQIDPVIGEEVVDPVTGKPVYTVVGIVDVFAKQLEVKQIVSTGTAEAAVPDGASIAVAGFVHASAFHGDGSPLEGVSKVGQLHTLDEIGSREVLFPGWTNPLAGPIDACGYVFQDGNSIARLGAYVLGGGG